MIALPKLNLTKAAAATDNLVFVFSTEKDLKPLSLSAEQLEFVAASLKRDKKLVEVNQFGRFLFLIHQEKPSSLNSELELFRKHGAAIYASCKLHKLEQLSIALKNPELAYALGEGVLLSSYQFLKYKSDQKKLAFGLKSISFLDSTLSKSEIKKLAIITEATLLAREWVNEPNSYLTSTVFAKLIQKTCEQAGCTVKVFDKKEITKLKMGGLLAVNQGSVEPPTFTQIEWKPAKARNKKPIVLVGKGVVYDTGGLSLKPTAHSMDYMKSDMAGAASVAATLAVLAQVQADVHVIGLIPSTDNRPSGNAYAPGDVVTMMNGKTVEVLNTDAEGRMILADALSYGDKFNPELIITTATLTGAAVRAIGTYGIVGMGTVDPANFTKMKVAGEKVYERVVEFPFWSEYDDEIKSDIADLKNLGSDLAGAITAGKFLAHFTKAPFLHLDIAGPSYLHKGSNYQTAGGTGVGVRLFTEFILNY